MNTIAVDIVEAARSETVEWLKREVISLAGLFGPTNLEWAEEAIVDAAVKAGDSMEESLRDEESVEDAVAHALNDFFGRIRERWKEHGSPAGELDDDPVAELRHVIEQTKLGE